MITTNYRVSLWTSKMSMWYEDEYPIQAEDATKAALSAMQQHKAVSMGVVIACSSTKQECFDEVRLEGDTLAYDKLSVHPRLSLSPFDYMQPSGSLARAIANVRSVIEGDDQA